MTRDIGVKSSPNVPKSCPQSGNSSFYLRMIFLKLHKKFPIIWATFVKKFVTKTFQKSPNLVTLTSAQHDRLFEFVFEVGRRHLHRDRDRIINVYPIVVESSWPSNSLTHCHRLVRPHRDLPFNAYRSISMFRAPKAEAHPTTKNDFADFGSKRKFLLQNLNRICLLSFCYFKKCIVCKPLTNVDWFLRVYWDHF